MWLQQVKFTFLGTYSHTWVYPSVRVVLSVTFIPVLCIYGLMILNERMMIISFLRKRPFNLKGVGGGGGGRCGFFFCGKQFSVSDGKNISESTLCLKKLFS